MSTKFDYYWMQGATYAVKVSSAIIFSLGCVNKNLSPNYNAIIGGVSFFLLGEMLQLGVNHEKQSELVEKINGDGK